MSMPPVQSLAPATLASFMAQAWCDTRKDAPGRTILFAACDSPESLAAFSWSRANLLREQDTVLLVHAYERDRVFGGCVYAEGQRVMAKFEALCTARNVKFQSVLAQGCPAKIITASAHAYRCDLCVMGCRGLRAVTRALVGSVRPFRPAPVDSFVQSITASIASDVARIGCDDPLISPNR